MVEGKGVPDPDPVPVPEDELIPGRPIKGAKEGPEDTVDLISSGGEDRVEGEVEGFKREGAEIRFELEGVFGGSLIF